ncbi:LLM class flavin-dependent oxidoreductase [Halorarius litoreus]|uniref:LLM class flavin-dependent oxidoreductase n=1 Tax=Halorarius litoreus TaxID=2962676 RepID=UPI0020CD8E3A|nr:LLM class flavin-dependent oxidoreductase [Halorarius litoreus]
MQIAVSDTVGPGSDIREQAELAAELDYDAYWTQELIDVKDGFTTATALGAWDIDIDIVVGLPSPYTRHPAIIATVLSSIDDYSDGRVKGLAIGTSAPEVIRKLNIDMDRPIKRLSEANDILNSIIKTGECTYEGEIYSLDNWKLRSEFSNDIPLYACGAGPVMQEMAAAKFDGLWLPFNATAPFTEQVVETGEENMEKFGRDREEFTYALNIPTAVVDEDSDMSVEEQKRDILEFTAWHCCSDHIQPLVEMAGVEYDIDELRTAVRENDSEAMADIVDQEFLDAVAAVGSPEHVRDRYREYLDTGIDCPVIYNYGPQEVKMRNVRELAPDKF